jgi:hypothetical protein
MSKCTKGEKIKELRGQLAEVCTWLCDWDEDIEPGNAPALAKHVQELFKARGYTNHDLRGQLAEANEQLAWKNHLGVKPSGEMYLTKRMEAEAEVATLQANLADAKETIQRAIEIGADSTRRMEVQKEESERQRETLRSLAVDVGGLCAREIQGGVCGLSSANHFSDCIPHIALAAAAAQEGKG